MVPADSDHVSRAWSYSGYLSVPLFVAYEAVTRYGGPSQTLRLNIRILNEVLQPRRDKSLRFGLFRVRSRYYSLSVAREYLALRDGPRRFGLTFTC